MSKSHWLFQKMLMKSSNIIKKAICSTWNSDRIKSEDISHGIITGLKVNTFGVEQRLDWRQVRFTWNNLWGGGRGMLRTGANVSRGTRARGISDTGYFPALTCWIDFVKKRLLVKKSGENSLMEAHTGKIIRKKVKNLQKKPQKVGFA